MWPDSLCQTQAGSSLSSSQGQAVAGLPQGLSFLWALKSLVTFGQRPSKVSVLPRDVLSELPFPLSQLFLEFCPWPLPVVVSWGVPTSRLPLQ